MKNKELKKEITDEKTGIIYFSWRLLSSKFKVTARRKNTIK